MIIIIIAHINQLPSSSFTDKLNRSKKNGGQITIIIIHSFNTTTHPAHGV